MAVDKGDEPPEKRVKLETTEKDAKEKKEKKDKSDKKDKKDGKEGHKDKKDKKEKKEGKEGKEAKVKKEEKGDDAVVKKEKKDKKDKKDKKMKDKKDKKDKRAKRHAQHAKDREIKKKKKMAIKQKSALKKKVVGRFAKKAKGKVEAVRAPAKVLVKTEDDYEPVNRWWEREDGADSGKRGAKKWDHLEHHGVMFADDYIPHGIGMKYDGQPISLSVEAEEVANFWTSCWGSTYETNAIFVKNFWNAFLSKLPVDTPIKELSKCDFKAIHKFRREEIDKRNNRSKEEKDMSSEAEKKAAGHFTHALLDNIRERLGAFKMEPPQLFRGRGEHPRQGMLKTRTYPEDLAINIGPDACVPKPIGMPGHAWKDIVHENTVQWVASFKDSITEVDKPISFGATSSLKGQPDMLKYDRARRLLHNIGKIRASYEGLQASPVKEDAQKGTATYFIDRLALRVGGEKGEDEADTVGCCSLRCEHLRLEAPNIIHFDFLGKDSIQYLNSVTVTPQVFINIGNFMKGKAGPDQVFDKVFPGILNEYFKEFMPDLSAKVFRTYNASFTLQTQLDLFDMKKKDILTNDELVKFYNDANREVAILCNHQKAESASHAIGMTKLGEQKDVMEKNIKVLKKHLQSLLDPSKKAVKMKGDDDSKLPKDAMSCKKKLAETKMRLDKHMSNMQMKEDNKLVSLGTSKMNYMDPRISVAWCKKVDLTIESVFPRTVRVKFPWAMHFKSEYAFD